MASRLRTRLFSKWTLVVLAAVAFGCGGAPASPLLGKLVPVTGTIKIDGQPVAGVMVSYIPLEGHPNAGKEMSFGLTDENGQYSLKTYVPGQGNEESSGTLPGEYRVYLAKLVLPDGQPVPEGMSDAESEEKGAKQLLPPKFSSPKTSELMATVADGANNLDFNLKK